MHQIYKFSDPETGFIHYILSRNIVKTLEYLDYLFRNYNNKVNSPLVRYLKSSTKNFYDLRKELVYENTSIEHARGELSRLELLLRTKVDVKNPTMNEGTNEVVSEGTNEVVSEGTNEVVSEGTNEVVVKKTRGRKKKVE